MPTLIVVVLPNNAGDIYNAVKQYVQALRYYSFHCQSNRIRSFGDITVRCLAYILELRIILM